MPAFASETQVKEVAVRLQGVFTKTKISQAALAKLSGVRADAIGRLLNADKKGHRRLPNLTALHRIAKALPHLTVEWLLLGDGPEPDLVPVDPKHWDQRFKAKAKGSQAA